MTRLALALALLAPAAALADNFQIDPAHSNATFAVKHMMISTVKGRFHLLEGTFSIDEANPIDSSVTATIGSLVRQATLYPAAGPAARLLVLRGRDTVSRRLELDPDAPTNLLVVPADAFGNPLPVRGLLAAVGDGSVLKVAGVTTDSVGGHVSLRPGRAGGSATNLALQASGLRTDLTASVRARRP